MFSKKLDPITVKRLKRFRQIKRAHWSLWVLVFLYILSLGSELLCNNKPLYIAFEGKSYFPILKYYPESEFTDSGTLTRPDYKKIASSSRFRNDPRNRMIFAPVPYGPQEILDSGSLDTQEEVTVVLMPRLQIGTINIRRDFTISKSAGCGFFFGVEDREVNSLKLSDFWPVPDGLRDAIQRRFDNEGMDAFSMILGSTVSLDLEAEITLSTFKSRVRSPKTVRLTFRQIETKTNNSRLAITFDKSLRVVDDDGTNIWNKIPEPEKASILDRIEVRFLRPVDMFPITMDDGQYDVSFEKDDIHWPYRPVQDHWLGIDNTGRDVLARILYGLRISMTFGFILVVFSITIGVIIGAVQGYCGGKVDILAQRVIEIWSALPFLYIMILMGSIYGRGFMLLLFLYGIFNWIGISYYMRAEFLKLRHQSFVEAAKCLGLPAHRIIIKHILPNALIPVITFVPFSLVGAIGSLAALDYLGFGLPPPTPSWGELLAQAQQFRWAWWLILYPSLALFTVMLLGVFVGEGVRNAFDPRQYSRLQ